MATRVANIRDGTFDPSNPDHVYIGRANPRHRLKASKWANPVKLPAWADYFLRTAVIRQYEHHLEATPELLAALPELRGKTLWCWCAPSPCHGDVLAELAESA